jgi:hypothetical protein
MRQTSESATHARGPMTQASVEVRSVQSFRVSCVSATLAAGLCAAFAQASVYSGGGGFLPDAPRDGVNAVSTFVISVADSGQVGTFNSLSIFGFTHTFLGDLGATLTAPDGTTVTLFERIGKTDPNFGFGDSSNFLGTYTFADAGASIWTAAASVPGASNVAQGTYFASAALTGAQINLQSALGGRSILGDWTLTITDYSVGEAGAISGWNLNLGVVPAPSACAVLLGLGLRSRRRR